jgi:hypothetical protein
MPYLSTFAADVTQEAFKVPGAALTEVGQLQRLSFAVASASRTVVEHFTFEMRVTY